MSGYRRDLSVESANTPTPSNTHKTKDYAMYKCMVIGVYYKDSKLNITTNSKNPQVVYEVVILGGFQAGQQISNVRLSANLGGQYNYSERVLRKASKPLHSTRLSEQDGDIVFVQFIQGNKTAPEIIGLGTNALDGDSTGATIEDGPRYVEQYNGIHTSINKDGEYVLTRKGGTYDASTDVFTPTEDGTFQSKITLNAEGIKIEGDVGTVEVVGSDGATLKLEGSKVALGDSNGDEILDLVSQICDTLSSTLGNLGFPLSTAGAFSSLKSKVDAIKASL